MHAIQYSPVSSPRSIHTVLNNPTRFCHVIGPRREDAERLLNFVQESQWKAARSHVPNPVREEVPPESPQAEPD